MDDNDDDDGTKNLYGTNCSLVSIAEDRSTGSVVVILLLSSCCIVVVLVVVVLLAMDSAVNLLKRLNEDKRNGEENRA